MKKSVKSNNYMGYIEKRLKGWANWFSRYHDNEGVGFNTHTRAYVLQKLGTMPQQEQKPRAPYNDDAEEIEYLINEMKTYDEKLANVLRAQYMGRGMIAERAKELGISPARFRSYVEIARHWIAARFLSVPGHPFSSNY